MPRVHNQLLALVALGRLWRSLCMHMLQQLQQALAAQQLLVLLAMVCAGSVLCKAFGRLKLHTRQQE
jgi:hypothetical protein